MPDALTTAEAANRAAVARDLADALAQLPGGTDPAVVAELPDKGWAAAAKLAGCDDDYVPSAQTRATVLRMLQRRQASAGADPFRGFPR